MKLTQMHSWFRQYAQQMGMQNTRAILPEQIDTLINTSTEDIVDEIIRKNVGVTNDRVITDNSKIATINALRSMYRTFILEVHDTKSLHKFKDGKVPYTFSSANLPPYRYIVDLSIRYSKSSDVEVPATKWFPIRVIDDMYLADVQNDYVMAPRARSPIVVVYSNTTAMSDEIGQNTTFIESKEQSFDVYFGETSNESVIDNLHLGDIRVSYIKSPVKVKYLSDVDELNTESDLAEHLQIPMLKHAVDLYRVSIQGSLFGAQQNAQANQQELVRNNVRPDNDGYQS
mgnify:CR=1 FL=1